MNSKWNDNRAQPEELNYDYYLDVYLCGDGTGAWTWHIEADDFTRLIGPRFWHAENAAVVDELVRCRSAMKEWQEASTKADDRVVAVERKNAAMREAIAALPAAYPGQTGWSSARLEMADALSAARRAAGLEES